MNIVDYRRFQIDNSETILGNIARYVMYKKNSLIDLAIDDDISCFTTTKGYNEGKKVCFSVGERKTNIFVPIPNFNDFYTYKMIPRIVQSVLVDDIFYFHPSYIKCELAKFYYKKDKANAASLIKGYKQLWILSANYNVLFTPHIFTVDDSKLEDMKDFKDIIDTEYQLYDIDCTINKRKRKLKCFVSKTFLETVKKYNDDESLLIPDIAFAKSLANNDNETFNIQLSDITFEQFILSSSIFQNPASYYLQPINTDNFKRFYTKNVSLAVAFFLYLYCICTRKDSAFDKFSKLVYGKSSSLKYRYIQAYQQVFTLFEKIVTNVLRKISKSKKIKDDEVTNLATEISRLSTITWNDIYNPYTEMRIRTSMTLPFKDLSDEMRELDKTMYGIICPIDTGDKDPGKVLRATENMDIDEVGRTQSSFRYSTKLMSLYNDNSLAFGHPFLDIYLKDKDDVIGSLIVTLVDKIDLYNINEYDSSFSYLNETRIINDKDEELLVDDMNETDIGLLDDESSLVESNENKEGEV